MTTPGSSSAAPSPTPPAGALRVFVSYSRDDIGFADQLVAALELTGFDVAIDRHGITGGEDFQRRLGTLVREADTIVFVLSPSSAKSEMCGWEVAEAVRLGKRIIPVLCRALEGTEPPATLKSLDYVFFYADPKVAGSGFGHGLVRLVAALNTDLDWLREHTRLLARATEWDGAGRPENRLLSGADIPAAKQWAAARPKGAPEPTSLHLDYIRASEDAEAARFDHERKRLDEVARIQAERGEALKQAEQAQKDKEEATRRVVRRTRIGAGVAVALALLAALFAYETRSALELAAQEQQRAQANLAAVDEALKVLDTEADPKRIALSFQSIGDTYAGQGRLEQASELYRRAQPIIEKQFGIDTVEVATLNARLGANYVRQMQYKLARPLLEGVLSFHERTGSTTHGNVAVALAMLAEAYKAAGETAKLTELAGIQRRYALQNAAHLVPVFYATDRARGDDAGGVNYGGERGGRLEFGSALVTIAKRAEERVATSSSSPATRSSGTPAPEAAIPTTVDEIEPKTAAAFAHAFGQRPSQAADKAGGQALVFVHGFNMTFETALKRAAAFGHLANFNGPVFVYSWPSGATLTSYLYDRESADQSAPHFAAFLAELSKATDARINILSHSLGSGLVLRGLRDYFARSPDARNIGHVAFVSPDVDRDAFRAAAGELKGKVTSQTLYVAAADASQRVASKISGGTARAGEIVDGVPLIADGLDAIDITAIQDRMFVNVPTLDAAPLAADIAALIRTGLRPPHVRSPHMEQLQSPTGTFWRMKLH